MSDVSVSAASSTIQVSTSSQAVGVSVSQTTQLAAVSAVGAGAGGTGTLAGASDVVFQDIVEGDVVRWSDGSWRNYAEEGLVDGGSY